MECELSDAILMDAIGMAKSIKSRSALTNAGCNHNLFQDVISSNAYVALRRMIHFIENSQSKFSSNYEILQSHLREIQVERTRQDDIDRMIKIWASEVGENDALKPEFDLLAQKEAKSSNLSENMRNELADLAGTMKDRALTYKQILTKDNEKLHNTATVHQKELERLQMENQKSKAVESNQSISFFQMLSMIGVSVATLFLCFFVLLLT